MVATFARTWEMEAEVNVWSPRSGERSHGQISRKATVIDTGNLWPPNCEVIALLHPDLCKSCESGCNGRFGQVAFLGSNSEIAFILNALSCKRKLFNTLNLRSSLEIAVRPSLPCICNLNGSTVIVLRMVYARSKPSAFSKDRSHSDSEC